MAHCPFLLSKEHDSNPIKIDLFSIVTEPRLAITLYFPTEYKPSDEGGWKMLLRDMQRNALKQGEKLISYSTRDCEYYITCSRHKLHTTECVVAGNESVNETGQYYHAHSKGKLLVRSKSKETKQKTINKVVKSYGKYMTHTTHPCCTRDKCNTRIKVFISTEFDRFIIISGYR